MKRILKDFARADLTTAILGGLAIFFAAFSLFHGPPSEAGGAAFVLTAPLAAAVILFALLAMWFELIRHGVVRVLYALSALAFLFGGIVYPRSAPVGWVFWAYWVPAALTIAGFVVIELAHVRFDQKLEVRARSRHERVR